MQAMIGKTGGEAAGRRGRRNAGITIGLTRCVKTLTNISHRNRIENKMKKERDTLLPGSFTEEPTEIFSGLGMYKGAE